MGISMFITRTMILAVIAHTLLTGCSKWAHPSATEADFYRDKNDCLREASQVHPPQNNTYTYGGYDTNCTSYGNTTNCKTTPPTTVKAVDYSGVGRSVYIENCLKGKGYYKTPSNYSGSSDSDSSYPSKKLDARAVAGLNGCTMPSYVSEHEENEKRYIKYNCQEGTQKEVMCDDEGCYIN